MDAVSDAAQVRLNGSLVVFWFKSLGASLFVIC